MPAKTFFIHEYECCHPKDIQVGDVFKTGITGFEKEAYMIDDNTIYWISSNSKYKGSMSAISQQLLYIIKN
jgi:hypothetical protein